MRPTSVEPVKVSLRTLGCAQKILPTLELEREVTTLKTPVGTPARSASTAMASALSGVSPAGFATKLHPAASAGATLRAIIAFGKFQGVIEVATPIGWRMTISRLSGWWPGMVSP